jgi:hypothetical protein
MKKAITFIILAAMLLVFPLSVAAATRTENINSFIAQKGDWFDPSVVESVKTKLAGLSETAFTTAINEDYRDPQTMLMWALVGIDRFFLDDTVLGVIKVVTGGGFGIWWIIDLFSIKKRTFAYNYNLLMGLK